LKQIVTMHRNFSNRLSLNCSQPMPSLPLRSAGRLFHDTVPTAAKHRSQSCCRSALRHKSSSRQNAADDDLLQTTAAR